MFREGNGWSHERCRRLWSLIAKSHLRYKSLLRWDAAMMTLQKDHEVLQSHSVTASIQKPHRVIVVERHPLLFLFNFSPTDHLNVSVSPKHPGTYRCILESDSVDFGGDGTFDCLGSTFCTAINGFVESDLSCPFALNVSCAARSCVVLLRL